MRTEESLFKMKVNYMLHTQHTC